MIKKTKKLTAETDLERFYLEYSFDSGFDFKNRVIRITGSIGAPFPGDISFTTFDMVDGAMSYMENKSHDPITIRVNSGGGCVYEGLAIIGRLKASPCQIITEGYGCVMSAATLILACGDVRKMSKFCTAMFHQSSYNIAGSHDAVRLEVEEMERQERLWAKWTAEMSSKPETFWYKIVKSKNVYLTADQMLKYGVVDAVI